MRPKVILIVDDDDTVADLLHAALDGQGYQTLTASNTTAAQVARQHRPDAVILDLHMGQPSGEEVYEQLRGNPTTKSIPVLLCSAVTSAAAIAKRLQVPLLIKPFDIALLEEQIAELVYRGVRQ